MGGGSTRRSRSAATKAAFAPPDIAIRLLPGREFTTPPSHSDPPTTEEACKCSSRVRLNAAYPCRVRQMPGESGWLSSLGGGRRSMVRPHGSGNGACWLFPGCWGAAWAGETSGAAELHRRVDRPSSAKASLLY